jgi:hypothetical protein
MEPQSPQKSQPSSIPPPEAQSPITSIPEAVKAVVEAVEQQAAEATLDGQPIGEAPDNTIPISRAKQPNKIELKRQQIFIDRLKRKMGEPTKDGKTKTQQQALAEIANEDYERLPADKKIKRLESIIAGITKQLGQDLGGLHRNDAAIADAFDINYRGLSKMFRHLGITDEQEKAFMKEAQAEFARDRQAKLEAELKASAEKMHKAKEADEKAKMEAEASKTGSAEPNKEEKTHVEEGATVFGG